MGQKVNPNGMRLGIVKDFNAKWYAEKNEYSKNLVQDIKVREYLEKKLKSAAVSNITIERPAQNINVVIHTARPGIVIGKKGEDIDRMRKQISAMTDLPTQVSVEEIRKPEVDSKLVADGICQQLEKRVMFRRAMKRAVTAAMRAGAQGVKVMSRAATSTLARFGSKTCLAWARRAEANMPRWARITRSGVLAGPFWNSSRSPRPE